MEAIFSSRQFWEWIAHSLVIFFLVGGIAGIAVGVSLVVNSAGTLRFFQAANRWVSMRAASRPLEIPRDTSAAVQKHRRRIGAVFIAGGLFSVFVLATQYEAKAAIYGFNLQGLREPIASWIVDSARWILIVGNLAAVVVGILLAFFPAVLTRVESAGGRWFSERKALKGGDAPIPALDQWVAAHPRRAGTVIAVASAFMAGTLAYLLVT